MAAEDDINKIAVNLEKSLKKSVSTNELKQLGQFVLEMIKDRVRRGFGVRKEGVNEKELKALSKTYKEQRKRLKLSSFTTPTKSNLTRYGRLIGGLRVTTRTGSVLIEPTGDSREGIPNEDIARYVSKARPFLNLSREEKKEMIRFFEEKILNKNIK